MRAIEPVSSKNEMRGFRNGVSELPHNKRKYSAELGRCDRPGHHGPAENAVPLGAGRVLQIYRVDLCMGGLRWGLVVRSHGQLWKSPIREICRLPNWAILRRGTATHA